MIQYFIEGKIIPERVDFNLEGISFQNHFGFFKLTIQRSKIHILLDAEAEITIPDLRNYVFSILGSIVNFVGFRKTYGLSYDIDSITILAPFSSHVLSVEGFVFAESNDLLPNRISSQSALSDLSLDITQILNDNHLSRATFELRNAIKYPDFTAHHCKLAIEAIRNAFGDAESQAWEEMRSCLLLSKEILQLYNGVAGKMRHGHLIPQTWQERQRAMQIAWEVCYRYVLFRQQGVDTSKRQWPVF
jgi:hypothetical protein